MKRLFLIPLLACALVACAETSIVRPLAVTCLGAGTFVNAATTLRQQMKLADAPWMAVNQAADRINPYCSPTAPPTLSATARQVLNEATDEVVNAIAGAQ